MIYSLYIIKDVNIVYVIVLLILVNIFYNNISKVYNYCKINEVRK